MLPRVPFVIPGVGKFPLVCTLCCSVLECFIIFVTRSPAGCLLDVVIQMIAAAWKGSHSIILCLSEDHTDRQSVAKGRGCAEGLECVNWSSEIPRKSWKQFRLKGVEVQVYNNTLKS